jgi:hypothetical protein
MADSGCFVTGLLDQAQGTASYVSGTFSDRGRPFRSREFSRAHRDESLCFVRSGFQPVGAFARVVLSSRHSGPIPYSEFSALRLAGCRAAESFNAGTRIKSAEIPAPGVAGTRSQRQPRPDRRTPKRANGPNIAIVPIPTRKRFALDRAKLPSRSVIRACRTIRRAFQRRRLPLCVALRIGRGWR